MQVYDKLADIYDKAYSEAVFGAENKIIIRELRQLIQPGMSVLDVGCGTGWLLDNIFIQPKCYDGIDISLGMVKRARQKHPNYLFVEGNVNDIFIPHNRYDVIVCLWGGFSYFDNPVMAVVHRIKAALKPGGRFYVMAYGYRYRYRQLYILNRYHIKHCHKPYYEASLRNIFSQFKNVEYRGLNILADLVNDRCVSSYLRSEYEVSNALNLGKYAYYQIITGEKR